MTQVLAAESALVLLVETKKGAKGSPALAQNHEGSCGFLGFSRPEKLAHAGENLLSKLREGQLTLNSEITSGLLAMVDAVRRMLGRNPGH